MPLQQSQNMTKGGGAHPKVVDLRKVEEISGSTMLEWVLVCQLIIILNDS